MYSAEKRNCVCDRPLPLHLRPIPAPGYHPEGMYEFKVDLDGDAVEDLTYRFTFEERDANGRQRYIVRCIRGKDAANPRRAQSWLRGTTGETITTPAGRRVWAAIEPMCCTRSAMPFKTAPRGFIRMGSRPREEPVCRPSIVLEVPDGELAGAAAKPRATVSMPAARPTISRLMERPSSRQLPASSPHWEPLKTRAPMGRK